MKIKDIVLSYTDKNDDRNYHIVKTMGNKYYLIQHYFSLQNEFDIDIRKDKWSKLYLYVKHYKHSRFKSTCSRATELSKDELFELQMLNT